MINKKIAVMQPYVFPYLGYFQLIQSVDTFVFYDDVNFIKKGWINKNRLLVNKQPSFFVIPCIKISQNKLINETEFLLTDEYINKLCRTFYLSYTHAPYFKDVFQLVERVLNYKCRSVSELAIYSIKEVFDYLDVDKNFIQSSNIFYNKELSAQDKIIDICKILDISSYVNMIDGNNLYNKATFNQNKINLQFLKPNLPEYVQFGNEFIGGLSIIDVLMFNNKLAVLSMLNSSEVIDDI